MILALALALLAGTPDDLQFRTVTQEWVRNVTTERRYKAALPATHMGLLKLLESPEWPLRENARVELANLGEDALPALLWGMRSRDPEVATVCLDLLKAIFAFKRCAECHETGKCTHPSVACECKWDADKAKVCCFACHDENVPFEIAFPVRLNRAQRR